MLLNDFSGNNLTIQQQLYNLRSETKDAFDEAKRLEARWKEVEKEQRDVYQVGAIAFYPPSSVTEDLTSASLRNFFLCV